MTPEHDALVAEAEYQFSRALAMAAEIKLNGDGWNGRWSAALTEAAQCNDKMARAIAALSAEVARLKQTEARLHIGLEAKTTSLLADIVEVWWSAATAKFIRAGKLRKEDVLAHNVLRKGILEIARAALKEKTDV